MKRKESLKKAGGSPRHWAFALLAGLVMSLSLPSSGRQGSDPSQPFANYFNALTKQRPDSRAERQKLRQKHVTKPIHRQAKQRANRVRESMMRTAQRQRRQQQNNAQKPGKPRGKAQKPKNQGSGSGRGFDQSNQFQGPQNVDGVDDDKMRDEVNFGSSSE